MTLANDPLAFAAASRANAGRDWTERLSEIRCPTLFVGGLDDPADPAAAAAVYRERLPDVETHLLPGVSHLLNVEAAGTLNALLLAFLDRVAD
jgi:pimeloyl-ACP methyl ester carboxylesterase